MFSKAPITFLPFLHCLISALSYTTKNIDWFPCKQNGTFPLTCGTLKVPLDYEDSDSNRSLTLQLNKVSAVKQPKKGSILINPGGPGEGGRETVAGKLVEDILIATGGVYDIIGFDPRGTGQTIPFSCFSNTTDRLNYFSKFPAFLNSSDTAIGGRWAAAKVLAESCYQTQKDVGELVGTGYVARDMMQIVDALHEDGLLHFWGFSYGTALGETVAAMFPDRMGHVVLDGVLNPRLYYSGLDYEEVIDSDVSFDGFFKGCIAAPTECALAQDGATAEILKQKFYTLLYSLKYRPLVAGTVIIDYTAVKTPLTQAMYNPAVWPILADGLHGLLTGNLTAFLEMSATILTSSPTYPNLGTEAPQGIRASDTTLRINNLTSVLPIVEEFYARSEIFGDWLSGNTFNYAQWPFQAKGAYTGDWCDIRTKTPILFVGSDVDPLTPLVSAINASTSFPGSVVLQHGGYGHTSIVHPSLCTAKAIRAYFVNGTLPAPGTKCEPEFSLFANRTSEEALAPIANYTKRAFEGEGNEDEEDKVLLGAVGRMGRGMLRRAG